MVYEGNSSAQLSAQNDQKIDSLNQIIQSTKSLDQEKIKALVRLGFVTNAYRLSYWDSIKKYGRECISKSEKNEDELKNIYESLVTTYNNSGYLYLYKGELENALSQFDTCIYFQKLISDTSISCSAMNNRGMVHQHLGMIEKSLKDYHLSFKLASQRHDTSNMIPALNNLAHIYLSQNDNQLALNNFVCALRLVEASNYKTGLDRILLNISKVYLEEGVLDSAQYYLFKSKKHATQNKESDGIGLVFQYIGTYYKTVNNLDSAEYYYRNSLDIFKNFNNKGAISGAYYKLASLLLLKDDLNQSVDYSNQSLAFAIQTKSPQLLSDAYYINYKVLHKIKNHKEALQMYETHIQFRDSVKNEKTQKATIRQQTKYEFEKAQLVKEQVEKETARLETEQKQRRDNLQYSIILVVILAVFGLVLSLGFISILPKLAEGLIFFAFLLLFEFLLVLSDPYVEGLTGGEPMYKLGLNAVLAGLIFPAHSFFERLLKKRLIDNKIKN